jgi:Restriction endonuclease HincII
MIALFQNTQLHISNSNSIANTIVSELESKSIYSIFNQKDYINKIYIRSEIEIKENLYNNPSLHFYLNSKADIENPFDEKQDDTADILVVKDGFYEIIDIKTRNLSKTAQAPNIISAFKLAQLCAIMLDNKEFDNLSINYFEVDWILEKDRLVCQDAHFVNLFKSTPENLYINWAAAMQTVRRSDPISRLQFRPRL